MTRMMSTGIAQLLDELSGQANQSREAYAQAARWAPPGGVAQLLATLAEERRRTMAALALEGGLRRPPQDDDPLPGLANRLLAQLRTSFAADRPRALIEECERVDGELAARLAAVADSLPDRPRATVKGCLAEVVAALGQLAALKVRLRGE